MDSSNATTSTATGTDETWLYKNVYLSNATTATTATAEYTYYETYVTSNEDVSETDTEYLAELRQNQLTRNGWSCSRATPKSIDIHKPRLNVRGSRNRWNACRSARAQYRDHCGKMRRRVGR